MKLQYAALSLRGTTHLENEDRALMGMRSLPPESEAVVCGQDTVSRAFAVFDGVGGYIGGAQAAEEALNAFSAACARERIQPACAASQALEKDGESDAKLARALRSANERVHAARQSGCRIGSAAAAAVVFDEGDAAHIFHAGDVRVYRYRAPYAMRLTRDHSLAERWSNEYPDIAPPDDIRHTITRSLGHPAPPSRAHDPFWPFEAARPARALPGDILVICSDGIWEYADEEDMESALATAATPTGLAQALELLAHGARERGSSDDATIVAIRIG